MSSVFFGVSSMMYQNSLRLHNSALSRATERLATGSRVNSAKDDPYRNYEALDANSEISSVGKAKQNSSDGAALLQIADGACNEIHSILQRVRELSIQSANDTMSSSERYYLDLEAQELLNEMDRIAAGTMYNAKYIFGSYKDEDSFSGENRTLKEWNPFIRKDADGNEIRAGILHIGQDANPGAYHDVNEVRVSIPTISAESLGLKGLNETFSLTYQGGATKAIDSLDFAISSIGTVRSYVGSLVNRMDKQVESLEDRDITMNDYLVKISDTDFARESTAMVTAQIQQQAAISIIAQSNSRLDRILEILG